MWKYRPVVDIQSAMVENRRGKKIEEEEDRITTGQKYNVRIC